MELPELADLLGPEQPSYRARQIYQALYHHRINSLSEITTIPRELRLRLDEKTSMGLPQAEQRYKSIDGTIRYLLRLEDGRTVETVLMPEEGRHTICISTQVGCPVDCGILSHRADGPGAQPDRG